MNMSKVKEKSCSCWTPEAVLLTKAEEDGHQVPVKLAAHTSLRNLIVLNGTLQPSNLLLIHALRADVFHD